MNVREMKIMARSISRDNQLIDAHYVRWFNAAYRDLSRNFIIPRLHVGNPVSLTQVSDGTQQRYYAPYDFSRTISFYDGNGRSLDVLPSEDVRQFGEYNSFGSFVQFYEHNGINPTPLYDSYSNSVTLGIPNRSITATASSSVFTSSHVGEWLLPIALNSSATASNPEDYAYLIDSVNGTTCTLDRPFRGVLSDSGNVSDLTTSYFQIRPVNTPIIRIWGQPGSSTTPTINMEYQRLPSKLSNDEDVPEESRLCEAIVYKAIQMAGVAYHNDALAKATKEMLVESLASFKNVKDFDKELIHNFISGNPNARTYSQNIGVRHMGMTEAYEYSGIQY